MPVLVQLVGALLGLALCTTQPGLARAYSTPDAFMDFPASGGGGGRWFSGSPADGYGCSVCHTGSPTPPTFPLLVSGLALDGYEPGTSREVVMSWPTFSERWKALRPDPSQPSPVGAPLPAVGMIAEFVAESGKASGTIEIRGGTAGAPERCEMTRPSLQPRIATQLYQVRPGVAPIRIRADRTGTLRCESRQLGQRCILALTSCGADEVRVIWKAPPSNEGPIWFSAGFVATDALSGTPDTDSVVELAMPMVPLASNANQYEHSLRNACSVAHVGLTRANTGLYFALLSLGLAWRARRHRKSRAIRSTAIGLFCVSLIGCGIEPIDHETSAYPNAGLHTPGSILGASDPSDTPDPDILYGDRCKSPQLAPGTSTAGELEVSYFTQTTNGRYAPKNVSAVWIETIDDQFVATLEIAAQLRRPGLVFWQEQACTERSGPDVVTSATKPNHMSEHKAAWSGVDLNGMPVPDGEYQLFIEVTETDKDPGDFSVFTFTKGATGFDRAETPTIPGLLSVQLTWTPAL